MRCTPSRKGRGQREGGGGREGEREREGEGGREGEREKLTLFSDSKVNDSYTDL